MSNTKSQPNQPQEDQSAKNKNDLKQGVDKVPKQEKGGGEQVTENDLKQKKVDADLSNDNERQTSR